MKDATNILKRYENNPILHVKNYPGIAQLYNPSVVKYGDEYIMLVSVVEHAATQGYGRDVGQTRIARSKDGVNFTLSDKNFIYAPKDLYGMELYHHFIDNRITKIDDTYYIITPVMVKGFQSPVGMLGKTKDFESYEPIDIITAPKNRGASLFPEKINGKYYKLDRPGGGYDLCDIWISASEDLVHWGEFKPVLNPGYRFWNVSKIGPTPPIKTSKGWLDIIHGVFTPSGGRTYYLGAILLDLEQPWRVIGKTNSYILAPVEEYEKHGNCDNTVFACGAIADNQKDEIVVYYGACDNYICMAKGKLSELIDACIEQI
ncbi:MAG: glycoside hydrolase family 130 protein [Clostridia bacterium]|nr:glycoside hydrolase family 130 protein [Clostridia bacterium]